MLLSICLPNSFSIPPIQSQKLAHTRSISPISFVRITAALTTLVWVVIISFFPKTWLLMSSLSSIPRNSSCRNTLLRMKHNHFLNVGRYDRIDAIPESSPFLLKFWMFFCEQMLFVCLHFRSKRSFETDAEHNFSQKKTARNLAAEF